LIPFFFFDCSTFLVRVAFALLLFFEAVRLVVFFVFFFVATALSSLLIRLSFSIQDKKIKSKTVHQVNHLA